MGTSFKGDDLYGHLVLAASIQNLVELIGHDFRSPDWAPQHCFIQQYTVAWPISIIEQLLTAQPGLDTLLKYI